MFFLTLGVKPLEVLLLKHYIVSATLDQRCEDTEGQELLLWVLFTGKASVFRDAEEDTWLVPQISQIASQLGLSTWEQVSRTLQKLPWVGIFSNDAARALWNRTESFSRPI
ncbi:hypothetical protein NUW58_g6427 [Xylaria curta]|uniref:Uncharacterized protein n=1 Tax=Xylaria curta TaxID=42375 RepID=A0ACC1NUB1_9PEZI|nr:hypothetical protein NUW58_g6427 [Xylaria curta]